MHGTTALAFLYRSGPGKKEGMGIMIGADSRLSNHRQVVDNGNKVLMISNKILVIVAGISKQCERLFAELISDYPDGDELNVYDVVNQVIEYLSGLVKEDNPKLGAIIAGPDGTDSNKHLRIVECYRVGNRMDWRETYDHVCIGSGKKYGLPYLKEQYVSPKTCEMSHENAAELALKVLYEASLHDRNTGGSLRVYQLDCDGYEEKYKLDALAVYKKFYTDSTFIHDERKTLIMLCLEQIIDKDLKSYFREGIDKEVVAVHSVAKKGLCYVHRLIFKSEDDATAGYMYVKNVAHPPPPLSLDEQTEWSTGVYLTTGVPIWMDKCTWDLVDKLSKMATGRHQVYCPDVLEAYYKYYDLYGAHGNSERTLLLVVAKHVSTANLNASFRSLGVEPVTTRRVAQGTFHLHRLFFKSKEDAEQTYTNVKNRDNQPGPFMMFNYGIRW